MFVATAALIGAMSASAPQTWAHKPTTKHRPAPKLHKSTVIRPKTSGVPKSGGGSAPKHGHAAPIRASRTGLWNSQRLVFPELGTGPAALSAFDLRFTNGDHKIRKIALLRDGTAVTPTFSDNDGNDPYDFSATYQPLDRDVQVKRATKRDYCMLTCLLEIDKPRGNEVFVLAGFSFQRRTDDRSIHRIAVRPAPERGVVQIEFVNDGGAGTRTHFLPEIQYAYIPADRVRSQHAVRVIDTRNRNRGTRRTAGAHVIQGFDAYFPYTEHHIRQFGASATADKMFGQLRDNDGDDYFVFIVEYAILR